jgi:hypothetical protein
LQTWVVTVPKAASKRVGTLTFSVSKATRPSTSTDGSTAPGTKPRDENGEKAAVMSSRVGDPELGTKKGTDLAPLQFYIPVFGG